MLNWIVWNRTNYIYIDIRNLTNGSKILTEKVPAFSHWLMKVLDSSLIITFIELSTHYDCFSWAFFNPIIFIFVLIFVNLYPHESNFIQPISYSSVSTIDSFVFHLFCCIFSIFKFWIFCLDVLMSLWSSVFFSFFNHSISFSLAPNFKLGTTNVFRLISIQFSWILWNRTVWSFNCV